MGLFLIMADEEPWWNFDNWTPGGAAGAAGGEYLTPVCQQRDVRSSTALVSILL
jgi:hypothetical protein